MLRFIPLLIVLSVLLFGAAPLRAQTPPDVSTGKALARVSLRQTDVRGYTQRGVNYDEVTYAVASYVVGWSLDIPGGTVFIANSLDTWTSAEEAHAEWVKDVTLSLQDSSLYSYSQNYGTLGIGDEDAMIYRLGSSGSEWLSIKFRHGTVTVGISLVAPPGQSSWDQIAAFANIVEARLEGQIIP